MLCIGPLDLQGTLHRLKYFDSTEGCSPVDERDGLALAPSFSFFHNYNESVFLESVVAFLARPRTD
jgi:hypothetical protein